MASTRPGCRSATLPGTKNVARIPRRSRRTSSCGTATFAPYVPCDSTPGRWAFPGSSPIHTSSASKSNVNEAAQRAPPGHMPARPSISSRFPTGRQPQGEADPAPARGVCGVDDAHALIVVPLVDWHALSIDGSGGGQLQQVHAVVEAHGRWAFAMKRVQDADCVSLGHQPGGLGLGDPAKVGDPPVCAHHAASDLAAENQGDDATGLVLVDAAEGGGLDVEAGLFPDLAAQAVVDALVEFEDTTGRFPAAAVKSADEQGAAVVVHHDPGDADRVTGLLDIHVDHPRVA